ncbi:MAG: hypothetical protein LBF38_08395 [Deltaproteobacteria bacterium]|jgi:sporulation protein YlmC with PRC-barrel domain|nr:hypothetical protein [Deltaproteobacteria bacterium]
MADFKMFNQEIRERSGKRVGKIFNQEIRNGSNSTIAKVFNQEIRDRSGKCLGKVFNQEIRDASNRKIATVSEARKQIDGSDILDPIYVAALWFCFVRRGL